MTIHSLKSTGSDVSRQPTIALYEKFRDDIYHFLLSHGLDPGEAQEVTQDVFVDLFVALQKGLNIESEQGWLYAVAGRAAVDYWSRERQTLSLGLAPNESLATNLPSAEPSPEAQVGRTERPCRVAAGLSRLPKEQRLCVQLRMQGLRYGQIAKILGVSTSTAADWLVSAVDYLRGHLNDQAFVTERTTAVAGRRVVEIRDAEERGASACLLVVPG
jgi:RNA polymerase sigma-70 factor (ECF subfamily)